MKTAWATSSASQLRPILEGQPFAMPLIVCNEGEPVELTAIGVQVEGEDAERAGERDPGDGLARRIFDLDDFKLTPVVRDFGYERPWGRRAGDQQHQCQDRQHGLHVSSLAERRC
jgi:hypothetical protein